MELERESFAQNDAYSRQESQNTPAPPSANHESSTTMSEDKVSEGAPHVDPLAVFSAQVQQLYYQASTTIYFTMGSIIVFVLAFWSVASHGMLLAWAAILSAVYLLRHAMIIKFLRTDKSSTEALAWGNRFAGFVVITGILWGSASVLFFPSFSPLHQGFLVIILGGLCNGALVVYCTLKRVYIPFVLLGGLPLAGMFLYQQTPLHVMMAMMVLAYIIVLIVTGHQINGTLRQYLTIRFINKELEVLNQIGREATLTLSVDTSVRKSLKHVASVLASDVAILFLHDDDNLALKDIEVSENVCNPDLFSVHRLGECLCGLAAKEGRPIFSRDINIDPRCTRKECKQAGLRSLAAIPLVMDDETLGVLALGTCKERDFSAQQLFLEALGTQITIGLKNALLYEQVQNQTSELKQKLAIIERGEKEKEELYVQLLGAQKMEAVGTLAGGIAHDFNNLLQAILGSTELLLLKKGPMDPDRNKLEIIENAARDGADLVSRILTFSRKNEPRKLPIDLNEKIRKSQVLLRRAVARMIDIELILEDDLHVIDADPAQIEQVLFNLAANAHHAMPDGGKLVIETRNVSLNDEYLRTHLKAKPGKYVLLTVSDTGKGIEPEILDRIYEPFFTTRASGEGTGLGLAMVHGIVSQHSGYIKCYSEPGVGTVFKIYFPASASDVSSDLTLTREMPAFGTETILVVDDDDRVREMVQEMIEVAGYKVLAASSGEEALETYAAHGGEISLVILDLVMPGMGGKRCLEQLLRIDPNARVLVGSGFSSNGLAQEHEVNPGRGFISKPYDVKGLLGAIRKVLDTGRL